MAVPEQVDLTVNIMGREFRIACPPDEEAALLASVAYLNDKMEEMRDAGKVIGTERIAIMTALQVAHESRMQALAAQAPVAAPAPLPDEAPVRERLRAMQQQIDLALQEGADPH